jgi:hypothetical protein
VLRSVWCLGLHYRLRKKSNEFSLRPSNLPCPGKIDTYFKNSVKGKINMSNEQKDPQPKKTTNQIGQGLAIGIAIGLPLGVAFHNIPIGLVLGIMLGAAIGTSLSQKNNKS